MSKNNIQNYRDQYIEDLNNSQNKLEFEKNNADSLFTLGLTMYSREYSFKSALYNAFSCSYIDDNLSLHPEQMKVLNLIEDKKGLIFSAPTSFGKTFVVFEYIARYLPKNVVLIVPTLALVDEYKQKIINKYKESFKDYKIYTNWNNDISYDFEKNNLFILTHDRVVNENVILNFPEIDFLVIDEVYKLKTDFNDDRVLILNLAYKILMEKANKYLLLAPFLKEIKNLDKIKYKPEFYSSNFSPVVNKIIERKVTKELERKTETLKLLNELRGTKCLVYFPTVSQLNKFIPYTAELNNNINENKILNEFINWASNEIHEKWSIIRALKNGILIHHGQLSIGIRILQLELFNDMDSGYDTMLCTSTLLEGVNTSCENIIITKPKRNKKDFDAFDFFNLVGRTGRLCQYYLGTAYYIRGSKDKEYIKEEALKSIEFELTDNSIDMDINSEKYIEHPEYLNLLKEMGITHNEYKHHFGTQFRFGTVKELFYEYNNNKKQLYKIIEEMLLSSKPSKLGVIRELYKIFEPNSKQNIKMKTFIINKLTYKKPQKVRKIIESVRKSYSKSDLDLIISHVLNLKNSYIEHDFYKKVTAILYLMELDNVRPEIRKPIEEDILRVIENNYFMNSSSKKLLKDMGIYETDIQIISTFMKTDINSIDELQEFIFKNYSNFKLKISIVSKLILDKLMIENKK